SYPPAHSRTLVPDCGGIASIPWRLAADANLRSVDNQVGFVKMVFFKIVALTAAVDDEEIGNGLERRQDAVPAVACDVDALVGGRAEGTRGSGGAAFVGGDDGQERAPRQRKEGLAAKRMPFHHGELQRQVIGPTAED